MLPSFYPNCLSLALTSGVTPFLLRFFNVVGEMRKPRDYTKAVVLTQSIVTMVYLIIGIIVYYYCGRYVSSPALGSAGPLLKRVAYGIAIPGLFASVRPLLSTGVSTLFISRLTRFPCTDHNLHPRRRQDDLCPNT